MIKTERLKYKSQKQFEMIDVTAQVKAVLESSGVSSGIVSVFAPHTTAAIRINHNEPLLMQDIIKMIYRLVPVDIDYSHDLFETRLGVEPGERSNGHAHVKTFLLGSSETIPVLDKQMQLGPKQSIFLVELDGTREREIVVTALGE